LKLPEWLIRFKIFPLPAIDPRIKKRLKIGILALGGAILLQGALFFSLRNVVLNTVLDKKIGSYVRRNEGDVFRIGSARFSGLERIVFTDIRLQSASGSIDLSLGACSIKVSFWNMILGRLRLKHLELNDVELSLRQGRRPQPEPDRRVGKMPAVRLPESEPAYAARTAALLQLFFNRVPGTLAINRLTFHSDLDQIQQTFHVPQLVIDGPAFATTVEIDDLTKKRAYYLTGNVDRGKKQLLIHLLPLRRGEASALPFIDRQWGLRVSFDSLTVGLKSGGSRHGVLRLDGSLAVGGLSIRHPRIATEDVNLENASLDYVLNIGADYFELDDATRGRFNKLSFHPYLKFKTWPTRQLMLKLGKTGFKADDLFSSLPTGLFSRLAGIKTSGGLTYELNFFIDFSRPELLSLQSDLEKSNFKIERFGLVNFTACADPFLFTAYEKNRAVRSFMVGPENPDFRSLDQLPPFLKSAVLISEDGAFFGHHGFLLGPIKESIAANIREKRFVRGASTISMQLIKNLYLKKDKTIVRKLEEVLITWLIEEKRLLTKERMYEIYLNIIEWGPLVYGAAEAARYYFDKDVSKLTLAEAMFMASIIPRPKKFMYSFDQDQHLRPWLQAYYGDVSYKMLKREMISQQDYDALLPDIRLKGPARFLLKGNENLPAEELLQDEDTTD
jgi:hypothetical protein